MVADGRRDTVSRDAGVVWRNMIEYFPLKFNKESRDFVQVVVAEAVVPSTREKVVWEKISPDRYNWENDQADRGTKSIAGTLDWLVGRCTLCKFWLCIHTTIFS